MQQRVALVAVLFWSSWSVVCSAPLLQAQTATLRGIVTLEGQNTPVEGASIFVVQLGQSALSDSKGNFEFSNLAPGVYTVILHLRGLNDKKQTVLVKAHESSTLNFQIGSSSNDGKGALEKQQRSEERR